MANFRLLHCFIYYNIGSFVDLFINLLPYGSGGFLIVIFIEVLVFAFFGLLFLIAIAK
ncbi:hypothetical protein [Methanobrevibacter arboriphilus]|uniref:hypothetical protein n=1 Tax=Methanobrevibacter arboriphilus TaxID=39441 RepID=UPI002492F9C0|nr:hypothetical protein [Methanobrevibacter arboriphilus]